ncbi:MAG: TRAP transporter large permease subunit [Tissierellia bacterium]|nr:TRAP transporter large permease subunit [Tissierellia bacterium]
MHREFIYLLVLLFVILISFILLKRPIYESMFTGFLVMVFLLDKKEKLFYYLIKPSTNTLFYAIVAFLSLAFILTKTQVVRAIIDMLLALVGRFPGGAGYVALFSSTFMAALSGSGPGNVAATGVFTIPTMIESGFPRALAATVEMSASSLGSMIPPSGTIILAFGILDSLYPGTYSLSSFWLMVWAVGLWFILQRLITLFFLCKKYKVRPVNKEKIPSLKKVLRNDWKALILPLLIFLPLYLDFSLEDQIVARLGEAGASAFSDSIILFTPGLAALYALAISWKKLKADRIRLVGIFTEAVETIVPVAATIYFAYSISYLFGDIDMGGTLKLYVESLNMTKLQLALLLPIFLTFLGMILPGSSIVAIFGGAVIASLAAIGIDPFITAAVLPALTGSLAGMTPPLAIAMYTAMGIAGSGMKETSKLATVWVILHLLVAILILLSILPILKV